MPASGPAVPSVNLVVVVDGDPVGLPVAEDRFDQCDTYRRQGHPGESGQPQLLDHDLENRAISDRQERLGKDGCERMKPRSFPPARITTRRCTDLRRRSSPDLLFDCGDDESGLLLGHMRKEGSVTVRRATPR